MWEPFTQSARHTIVRAQEVAQMFASNYIGTEHIAFALAENDDQVGQILATAIDRDELRERLGAARQKPPSEMVFTGAAKRAIELSFENARRLSHDFIGSAHLALGILQAEDEIPLRAGADLRAVRAELEQAALSDRVPGGRWIKTAGPNEPHAAAAALLSVLHYYPELAPHGTQVSIRIERPDAEPLSWTWTNAKEKEKDG
ncbi:MAG TPA: Clp protease N-terminal domain-containing protein [Candidatus Limnocylindrales bacterium]|nr:Clp protease N-terminal domain-containing protein [Candidatus Limnocylindrales bacterium]